MIKLINLLKELDIQSKPEQGAGNSHTVYTSKNYPDRVIKIPNSQRQKEVLDLHIKMFRKYPKFFPKVYKFIPGKYMVIEKLNQKPIRDYIEKTTNLAKKILTLDNPKLPKQIKDFFNQYPELQKGKTFQTYLDNANTLDLIEYIIPGIDATRFIPYNFDLKYDFNQSPTDDDIVDFQFNWLVKQDSGIFNLTKKIYDFYWEVNNNVEKDDLNEIADWHGENIALDKKGEVKYLDF
tara:strand:+ start:61 stop:768 length:708 start_codon:yes stop_codon:yes gene_type:complete